MYLENTLNGNKFYEIVRRKNVVYMLYGKIPLISMNTGAFIKYEFDMAQSAKQFYDEKIDEKLKKNYEIKMKNTTDSMKQAYKLRKPKIGKISKKPVVKKKPSVKKQSRKKPVVKKKQSRKKLPKIVLKKGELGKYGYKDVKTLTLKKRREALDKAINEYGAQKVLKKLGLIKTYQKNKNPVLIKKLMDNMKWSRKKFDSQFKSSWKTSALFKKN